MSTHIINFPGADIHTTTLTSVSNVSVGENLDVTSNLTVSGNATVSGNVEMSSNLTVSGNATVSGNVEMSSNLTVSGDTTVSGNVEMSSNLTVSGNVELSSNLTVSGNVGVGVTNPTTRFAVLDEARQSEEFPPRAMTDYETHMEGHGVFKVSESSVRSGEDGAYALFTKDDGTTFWHSDNTSTDHRYTQDAAGTYSGTSSFDGIDGEWVTLECPYSIKLDSIQLHIRSLAYQYQSPEDWALLGSNDGTNWGTLKEVTGQIISESGTSFDVSTSQYYKMFALVVTRIANNVAGSYTNALTFGEWRLFGTRERGQSTLHDGELKLNKSLMVPRIGPPLDTDDTPRRDRLVVEYNTSTNPTENGVVQDTSGNGLDGVLENTYSPGNATYDPYYDATEKALVFDGSNDYVTKNLTGISGDFIFSASLWVYHESSTNNAAQFFTIGNNATNQMVGFRLNSSMTSAYVYFYSADTLTATISTVLNTWNHFVVTYDGSTQRLYQNGVLVESNSGSGLNLPQDPELRIGHRPSAGSTEYLDGYLSNFKLYDVALTAEEAKRLYDMGRCDEGHHVVNFSKTRVGIGLGDGEAPRAVLDVRGDIFGPGIIQVQSTTFNGIASGNSNSFTELPELTTRITPKRSGSKILVLLNLFWSGASDAYFQGNVKKNGSVLVKQEGSVGNATKTSFAMLNFDRAQYFLGNIGFSYLDGSNIGTQSIEYTVEVRNRYTTNGTWYINYTSDTADANRLTGVSTLTLIEIQQ